MRYLLHHKGLSSLGCVGVANPGRVRPLPIKPADTTRRHAWSRTSVDTAGYNIRRNVVQSNGNFGIDLRSRGGRPTVVDQNCIRNNGVGLIGDFADLRDATIRSNTFVGNDVEAISVSGLKSYANISITQNVIRRQSIVATGLVGSEISHNDIDVTGGSQPCERHSGRRQHPADHRVTRSPRRSLDCSSARNAVTTSTRIRTLAC